MFSILFGSDGDPRGQFEEMVSWDVEEAQGCHGWIFWQILDLARGKQLIWGVFLVLLGCGLVQWRQLKFKKCFFLLEKCDFFSGGKVDVCLNLFRSLKSILIFSFQSHLSYMNVR